MHSLDCIYKTQLNLIKAKNSKIPANGANLPNNSPSIQLNDKVPGTKLFSFFFFFFNGWDPLSSILFLKVTQGS